MRLFLKIDGSNAQEELETTDEYNELPLTHRVNVIMDCYTDKRFNIISAEKVLNKIKRQLFGSEYQVVQLIKRRFPTSENRSPFSGKEGIDVEVITRDD